MSETATQQQQVPNVTADDELASIAKIQMYQQDLRKRKEQEDAFQREQEFLRNSLRDSQKLRDLQESGPKALVSSAAAGAAGTSGFVNPNYMIEEEESVHGGDSVSKSSTLPVRQSRPDSDAAAQPPQLGKSLPVRQSDSPQLGVFVH